MRLQLTKYGDKKHVIKYLRDNGKETWMHSDDFFVVHDLSHFAIEKTLGYTTAFCGMLNNGTAIQDFEDRVKRNAMVFTQEAMHAENMANLFLMETVQGNFEDINTVIKESFADIAQQYPAPVLSEKQIEDIRKYLRALLEQ